MKYFLFLTFLFISSSSVFAICPNPDLFCVVGQIGEPYSCTGTNSGHIHDTYEYNDLNCVITSVDPQRYYSTPQTICYYPTRLWTISKLDGTGSFIDSSIRTFDDATFNNLSALTESEPSCDDNQCADDDDDGTPNVCDACPSNSDIQTITFKTYISNPTSEDNPDYPPGEYCGYTKTTCDNDLSKYPARGYVSEGDGFYPCSVSETTEEPSTCTTDEFCNPLVDGEPWEPPNDNDEPCECPDIDNDGTPEDSCPQCDSDSDPNDPNDNDNDDPNDPNDPDDDGCICPGGGIACVECGDFTDDDLDPDDNDDSNDEYGDNDGWNSSPCDVDFAPLMVLINRFAKDAQPFNYLFAVLETLSFAVRSEGAPIFEINLFNQYFIIDLVRFDPYARLMRFFFSITIVLTFVAAFCKLYLKQF